MKPTNLFCLALAASLSFTALGCSEGAGGSYPKDVSIEYVVSSSTDNAQADITYSDSAGEDKGAGLVSLPYSVTVERTIEEFDSVSMSASVPFSLTTPDDLVLEVKVDGETVATQTETNANNASLYYSFE